MTQSKQEQKRMDSNEHILACLSSAPSNAKIIRTAARMANAFGGQFTALFVETPDFSVASKENKERLQENGSWQNSLELILKRYMVKTFHIRLQSLLAYRVLQESFLDEVLLPAAICLESRL